VQAMLFRHLRKVHGLSINIPKRLELVEETA
jgi:hypothetical protein